ncbi:ECF transporter S component [Aquibacillus sediminis]|uniref:ECF transporter S component n=1 Tax=Aquibacillus sediminis TaxID=2574734 RepID=UPI0011086311|nr:ECF transporter S component [Aquibacillus sediminis]
MQKSSKLLKLITFSLLGTVSFLVMFLNFPLPFLPAFLKIDFSDVPALIAALIFSPVAGVIVELIKNILHLLLGGGEPVGVTANLIAGILFVVPVALIYHRFKGVKSIVSGLVASTIIMTIAMGVLNYYFLLPAYSLMFGIEEYNTAKFAIVTGGVIPFNIVKGIIVGLLFIPLFTKLRPWMERKQASFS